MKIVKLSDITKGTVTVTVTTDKGEFEVVVDTSKITPEYMDAQKEKTGAEDQDFTMIVLSDVVVELGLQDEKGKALKADKKTLRSLPYDVLNPLAEAVMSALFPQPK